MTPRKITEIGMLTLNELMGGGQADPTNSLSLTRLSATPAEIKKARVKVHQGARRQAMLAQRDPQVEAFPVGNRAARRLAASRKAKEKPL